MVIRSAQLTVAAQPGVGPLDAPALRLHLKAALPRQPLDHLQLTHATGRHPRAQHAALGLVSPDLLQSDAARFGRRNHLRGGCSVILSRRVNTGRDQQAQRISEPMALAPIHLLAAVKPPFWPASDAPLGALGVDYAAGRLDVLPSLDFDPHPSAQCVVDLHQDAVLGPLLEVVVDRALRRKGAWQHLPLAPALELGEQAVAHGAQVDSPLRSGLGLHLDLRAEQLPLCSGQVGRVRLALDSRLAQCYHRFTPRCGLRVTSATSAYHS